MIKHAGFLDVTQATEFVPGTNIKGDVAGANWLFLLPSLVLDQVLCLGAPRLSTLRTLARMSQRVVVLDSTEPEEEIENVVWYQITNFIQPTSVAERYDVIVIAAQQYVQQFKRSAALQAMLTQLSGPQTLFYWEEYPSFQRDTFLKLPTAQPRYYWLTPLQGEAVTAVPLEDRWTADFFLDQGLFSPTVQQKMFKPIKKLVGGSSSTGLNNGTSSKQTAGKRLKRGIRRSFRQVARVAGLTMLSRFELAERALNHRTTLLTRRGVLTSVSRDTATFFQGPPQYLCDLADDSRLDITHYRWGLVASGEYSSRKVLCFLFPGEAAAPEFIVKIVRDARFNTRLENEVRALTLLHEVDGVDGDTFPQVAFSGYHTRLAMVGETFIGGVPFRQRTTYREDCPCAAEAVAWFTRLGEASADSTAVHPAEVGARLGDLLSRLKEIYPVTPEESAFMEQQFSVFQNTESAFPTVFQHGDPGTWNLMIQDDGRLAVLDWEAAEPTGIPLWDLFYFLRSYAAGAAKKEGIGDRIQAFRHQFLEETPINRLITQSARHYADRIGVAPEFIQPLLYACWMHRALKESTRLTEKKLAKGHYFNILRLCIREHEQAALQRLFQL